MTTPMKELHADIVIFGAGISGLWTFHHLKAQGYNAVLLESNEIGSGQTIASQGIVHSGLKYVFGGKLNDLAKSISAMPDRWRAALKGEGTVNLQGAKHMASSQYLLIPPGAMRGLLELVTTKALGGSVHKLKKEDWPDGIHKSGFKGTAIFMDEPVLDANTVIHALAEPYLDSIRKIEWPDGVRFTQDESGAIEGIIINDDTMIKPEQVVFTAAQSNERIARLLGHDDGLETQARPLLMGMMKNAPFRLHAHCVGPSDKPVMTVTTHPADDGSLVWYLGGSVAERPKDDDPQKVIDSSAAVIKKYLPDTDLSHVQWDTLPIDRIEGKRSNHKKMPDSPVLHSHTNAVYAWPTKLTFAPLLSDMVSAHIETHGLQPSCTETDWSGLPPSASTTEPCNKDIWDNSATSESNSGQQT